MLKVEGADGKVDDKDFYTSKVDPGDTYSKDPGDTNSGGTGATGSGGTGTTGNGGTGNTGSTQPSCSTVDPGDTNSNAVISTDRPYAAVGIIGTKD